MKKSTFSRWLAVWLLAPAFLLWASVSIRGVAATGKAGNTPATDPRLDMVTALEAMGPHPSLGDQAKVFGRFVGTWDVEYIDFSKDGKVTHRSGELIHYLRMKRKRSVVRLVRPEAKKRAATGAAVMQPRVTDALTRALFMEWARVGYAALSLEAVAKRAGVGKAALYRRWPSKLAMVTDRLETVGVHVTVSQDTGSLEGDLRALLLSIRDLLKHRMVRQILADLHAEMTRNSQLADRVRNRLQKERRSRGTAILLKAIARDEIPKGTHEELFNDLGAAALYWRQVVIGAQADDCYVEALVQVILDQKQRR